MTNSEIISKYMQLNNLDINNVVLHTYNQWKNMGYIVKRGEKAKHKITIWKKSIKKVKNEDDEKDGVDTGRFFLKTASFFTQEQVERIEN